MSRCRSPPHHAQAHGGRWPTYSYLFSWPTTNPRLGECHGIDIPFTFGNFVDGWGEFSSAPTNPPDPWAAPMREAWANLARSGNPGWPAAPVDGGVGRELTLEDDPLRSRLDSIAQ